MSPVALYQSSAGRLWVDLMPSTVSKTPPETCPGMGTWCLPTAVPRGRGFAPQLLGWAGPVLQRKHVLFSPLASLSCLQLFYHRE